MDLVQLCPLPRLGSNLLSFVDTLKEEAYDHITDITVATTGLVGLWFLINGAIFVSGSSHFLTTSSGIKLLPLASRLLVEIIITMK